MFFSLNKKLIYTITVFFLFTSLIFIYAFYILNANKIREEQKSAIARNQQYIELLYQNISLRKELSDIKKEHPVITLKPEIGNLVQPQDLNEKQKQISLERKRADETLKNYDDRYQALAESFKIVLISAVLFFFALLALWILIRIWVLKPIDKLSKVSRLVLAGNYASRLQLPPDQFFSDEFDNLMHTFNSMLDNIENGIREIRKTESFLQSLIDSIPEEKKYLTLIDKQLVECINVPERLLKMAQFSQEEQSKFSLQSGIHDVISLLDYEAKRNGISISFQTPQKEASLLGNEADFKMMIMNLMQNALKAMPDGGSLAVRLSVGKQIKIEIEDTGQGIPADKLKRIFEPFYSQGHSSQHQGTGLGLAIVKSIVEKLNGTIEVKSKPGLGTCFTIKFPLK
ncbi:MAG: ATP-binding protein [Alphaproteobacteria bacterium]